MLRTQWPGQERLSVPCSYLSKTRRGETEREAGVWTGGGDATERCGLEAGGAYCAKESGSWDGQEKKVSNARTLGRKLPPHASVGPSCLSVSLAHFGAGTSASVAGSLSSGWFHWSVGTVPTAELLRPRRVTYWLVSTLPICFLSSPWFLRPLSSSAAGNGM